ncbi:MAG TPA: dockerin type I domain-containing protein [Candidatus Limnocylindrales bacterium]|nr:dockerin type I domain-containing protein [Candidatus Limnocylindrales bacterium]
MNVRPVLLAVAIAAVAAVYAPVTVFAGAAECTGPEQCDDANSCTTDSCVALACVNDPAPNVGATCSAQSGCSIGLCGAQGDCVSTQLPNDTPCPDSAFCNGAETCQDGVCTAGDPACDDEVGCTADQCNEATDSCTNTPQDVACNDGLACNGVETCDATLDCQEGTPIDCSDGVGCTDDVCDEATDSCVNTPDDGNCDDMLFCNGDETCHPTLDCQGGMDPCIDAVACTVDTCNEILDSCTNAPNDLACNNGDFCDGTETCDSVFGCTVGEPPCEDDVECTVDSCDETLDMCGNAPDHTVCDDEVFCNGEEFCDAGTGCVDGAPETCDDGITCTTDSCNTGSDSCENAPVHSVCTDGLFCNGEEMCDAGSGCVDGDDPDCDDEIACTNDSCIEESDSCANTPDHSACADPLFCNGEEICDAGTGCIDGEDACDDEIVCTVDACDEIMDSCSNVATDVLCSDGEFCTGDEVCDQQLGCMPGNAPDCSDGVDCTADQCNELLDGCDHAPVDSFCDDADVCDGAETCNANSGCQDGTPLVCNDDQFCNGDETCDPSLGCQDAADPCADQIDCTVDTCDEVNDTCTGNVPDDNLCDNQQFCDGEEFCDANSGCMDGADPCEDQVICTEDTCNEVIDGCTNLPDNSLCDDSDPCTVDTCSVNADCQNVELPDFDDDGQCDARDNCPLEDNPDQLNSDCTDEEFQVQGGCAEIGFNPLTDERRGCCDGGDVCDPCPARTIEEDGAEQCNPDRSGGISCPPEQGCELTTADGCITVSVPPGALEQERTISVTDSIDEEQNLLARDALLYEVGLRPEGIDFAEPVEVTLCWDDRDDDDNADEGICGAGPGLGQTCDDDFDCGVGGECDRPSRTREEDLVMKRNAAPFSKEGLFEPPYTCDAHDAADSEANDCDTAAPDCSEEADEDDHTVAGCCDRQTNTWDFRTCGFSEHFLGEFAGDLVPGNGPRQTDCVSEWSVVNPQNEPYRDAVGMPSNEQTCRDGDPLCDHDGAADGKCTFHVGVCFNIVDRRLTDANDNRLCTPTNVEEWNLQVSGEGDDAGDLAAQVAALGGGTAEGNSVTFGEALDDRDACTRHVAIEAPVDEGIVKTAGGVAGGIFDPQPGTTFLRMATSRSTSTDDPDIGPSTTTSTTMLEQGPQCGDADDDGEVDATDALITLRTAVGTSSCDPVLCDVTTDGSITASDALAVLKTAVGQELETACGLGALPSDRDRLTLTCTPAEDVDVK